MRHIEEMNYPGGIVMMTPEESDEETPNNETCDTETPNEETPNEETHEQVTTQCCWLSESEDIDRKDFIEKNIKDVKFISHLLEDHDLDGMMTCYYAIKHDVTDLLYNFTSYAPVQMLINYAIKDNDLGMIRKLIDFFPKEVKKETSIVEYAIRANDLSLIKKMVAVGYNIKENTFHSLIEDGIRSDFHNKITIYLIERNVFSLDKMISMMKYAAIYGNIEVLTLLFKNQLFRKNELLVLAKEHRQCKTIKFLMANDNITELVKYVCSDVLLLVKGWREWEFDGDYYGLKMNICISNILYYSSQCYGHDVIDEITNSIITFVLLNHWAVVKSEHIKGALSTRLYNTCITLIEEYKETMKNKAAIIKMIEVIKDNDKEKGCEEIRKLVEGMICEK